MLTPSDEILSIPATLCGIGGGVFERSHKSPKRRRKARRRDPKMVGTSQTIAHLRLPTRPLGTLAASSGWTYHCRNAAEARRSNVTTIVGEVARLWRFPVKSMLGEALDDAHIGVGGLLGDRAYAIVDSATNKVVSAKNVKLFPAMLECRAAFVELPRPDAPLPAVRITLPNGTTVTSDAGNADAILSAFFGRDVVLARTAPETYIVKQATMFEHIGLPSTLPAGSLLDAYPLSVLTTSTLARLSELRPASRFDERRFRMNVIVRTHAAGFAENGWVDRRLAIGTALRLHVAMPDPRCALTTLGQGDLPVDGEVLQTLIRHNNIAAAKLGNLPCAGVYASVEAAGTVASGDQIKFA
jgi:uncharacterized protein YcbX